MQRLLRVLGRDDRGGAAAERPHRPLWWGVTRASAVASAVHHALSGAREMRRPEEATYSLGLTARDLHDNGRLGVAQTQSARYLLLTYY